MFRPAKCDIYLLLQDELTDLKQRYGDTRVSVLGFKARIMKLTGELKQHRDPNAISSIQEVCCLALLMISVMHVCSWRSS